MTQKQGRCIFCDGTGLSKEHIWPDWLKKVLKRVGDDHRQELLNRSTETGKIPLQVEIIPKQGKMGSRKVRNVCKRCNNGWMSDLQQEAIPILTELIEGKSIQLDQNKQKTIAKWMVMTSIMGEFTNPTVRGISDQDRHFFYSTQAEIPSNWRIWISSCEIGEDFIHRNQSFMKASSQKEMEEMLQHNTKPNGHFTALVLGKLCLFALSVREIDFATMQTQLYDNNLVSLVPPNNGNIDWPNKVVLGEADFNLLSNFTKSPQQVAYQSSKLS